MKKTYIAPLCEVVKFSAQESLLATVSVDKSTKGTDEDYTDEYDSHKRDLWYDSTSIWGDEE